MTITSASRSKLGRGEEGSKLHPPVSNSRSKTTHTQGAIGCRDPSPPSLLVEAGQPTGPGDPVRSTLKVTDHIHTGAIRVSGTCNPDLGRDCPGSPCFKLPPASGKRPAEKSPRCRVWPSSSSPPSPPLPSYALELAAGPHPTVPLGGVPSEEILKNSRKKREWMCGLDLCFVPTVHTYIIHTYLLKYAAQTKKRR